MVQIPIKISDEENCIPASIMMAVIHWRKKAPTMNWNISNVGDISEFEGLGNDWKALYSEMTSKQYNTGNYNLQIQEALKSFPLAMFEYFKPDSATDDFYIEKIEKFIDFGYPCIPIVNHSILLGRGRELVCSYHAFVLTGYTEDNFISMDPFLPGDSFQYPKSQVINAIQEGDVDPKKTLIIYPKEQKYNKRVMNILRESTGIQATLLRDEGWKIK